jgi:hypothetical protein
MKTRINISSELKELNSSLPSEGVREVYSVPEGYFEQFAASMLERVRSVQQDAAAELDELSPLLASLSKKMPFNVPDGYFEQNNLSLPAFTSNEESSILAQADKSAPYSVPEGYFDALPGQMLAKVAPPKAKVVSMTSRVMRWAVAAMIAGVIAVSGYFYFDGNSGQTSPDVDHPLWVAQKLKNVDNQDLKEFIETTDITLESTQTATKKPGAVDVKTMLKDVSDKELESFLSQVPTEDDALLMN